MDSLIVSNIRQRPTRTLISVAGVALGVLLVVLNTGLVRGMLNDRIRRERGIGAEIQFTRKGSSVLSPSSVMSLDIRYGKRLSEIEGVKTVSPVGRYIQSGSSGLGFEQVDGIDFDTYSAISGLKIVEGRVFNGPDEVIIDEFKARQSKLGIGSTIQVFGRSLKVAGIYAPESGARIKMNLTDLQGYLAAENKCTFIMVKVDDPNQEQTVQKRIDSELPGNIVLLTRDIATGFSRSIPGIDGFVKAVLGLSTIVSILVILLAMYTTITERTREIGILKSLGASNRYIIGVIEKEALLISLIGVAVGMVLALAAGWAIERATTLQLEFHWTWLLTAALIGLSGGALGALYPAIRAARQDPVEALAYE
ncbi:MAG: ABC transporter permease [Blastocatellales bacterium]